MGAKSKKGFFFRMLIPIILALFYFSIISNVPRRAYWYEELLFNMLLPFEWGLNWVSKSIHNTWSDYVNLVNVKKENELLKIENAKLKGDLLFAQGHLAENERLNLLLKYSKDEKSKGLFSKIIVNDPKSEFKSLTIDKGLEDGVDISMPVMGYMGLVGRVERVFDKASHVLLLTDPNSAVDVEIQGSGTRGILVGTVSETHLRPAHFLTRIEYLDNKSAIVDGDIVITSGFDGIFPRGLAIGTVKNIARESGEIFESALVVPFDEYGELKEVFVVTNKMSVKR